MGYYNQGNQSGHRYQPSAAPYYQQLGQQPEPQHGRYHAGGNPVVRPNPQLAPPPAQYAPAHNWSSQPTGHNAGPAYQHHPSNIPGPYVAPVPTSAPTQHQPAPPPPPSTQLAIAHAHYAAQQYNNVMGQQHMTAPPPPHHAPYTHDAWQAQGKQPLPSYPQHTAPPPPQYQPWQPIQPATPSAYPAASSGQASLQYHRPVAPAQPSHHAAAPQIDPSLQDMIQYDQRVQNGLGYRDKGELFDKLIDRKDDQVIQGVTDVLRRKGIPNASKVAKKLCRGLFSKQVQARPEHEFFKEMVATFYVANANLQTETLRTIIMLILENLYKIFILILKKWMYLMIIIKMMYKKQ